MTNPPHDDQAHPRNLKDGKFVPTTQSAPDTTLPAPAFSDADIDAMDGAQLAALRGDVVERLGIRGPWIDRSEAEYRLLEDPGFYKMDVSRISALRASSGSDSAFIDRVIDTNAWAEMDDINDGQTQRMTDTIKAALDELDNKPPTEVLAEQNSISDVSDQEVRRIRGTLFEKLGVRGPYMDRSEAEYRLIEDPHYYGLDTDRIRVLRDAAGSDDAFISRIVDTDAWVAFDEIDDRESARVTASFEAALTEIEAAK